MIIPTLVIAAEYDTSFRGELISRVESRVTD